MGVYLCKGCLNGRTRLPRASALVFSMEFSVHPPSAGLLARQQEDRVAVLICTALFKDRMHSSRFQESEAQLRQPGDEYLRV